MIGNKCCLACYNQRGTDESPHAGGASKRLEVFAMVTEILNALAAVATVGGFLLEVSEKIYRLCKRKSARMRMTRKEKDSSASENK